MMKVFLKTNEKLIREAYDFGLGMHEGQYRHSGEPYFTHPVEVAVILTEQQLDVAICQDAAPARPAAKKIMLRSSSGLIKATMKNFLLSSAAISDSVEKTSKKL